MNCLALVAAVLVVALLFASGAPAEWKLASPGGVAVLTVRLSDGGDPAVYPAGKNRLYYAVECGGKTLLSWSPLGIARRDQEFVDGLVFVSASHIARHTVTYVMPYGRRRECSDDCAGQTLTFRTKAGPKLELDLRAYDDGVAFRYRFPETDPAAHVVVSEATGFRLPEGARAWMHPYDEATEYTPAYETYYECDIPAGTRSPNKAGWAFPVLFTAGPSGPWGLLAEAAVDRNYCGCRLAQDAPSRVYTIRLPDAAEGNGTGAVEPTAALPWTTPWRVIHAASTPCRFIESTLVNNLNPPSLVKDTAWIKPGRASWSWLSDHDSPQDFTKLRAFVDLAAEMGWEYSLVDANWTIMKNGTIHDLCRHAKEKGVGLLLWYNSGGIHNYVSEKPHGLMWHEKIRRKEFELLRSWGVAGVKVDFFQSDKQNIMTLYQDILADAAEHKILVNFHGCTLPRGWSRTYPHLMSMEAVRGAECYSFDRRFTAMAPRHNTTIPFTRNAVGPMDYTPVMLRDNVYPHVTTAAHELALAIVFESGILHFADGVEAYRSLPDEPKRFLKRVPVAWDETRCLAGEPGRYVVVARRQGSSWFVGAIGGEENPREIELDLAFIGPGEHALARIEDGAEPRSFECTKGTVGSRDRVTLALKRFGGAVLEFERQ